MTIPELLADMEAGLESCPEYGTNSGHGHVWKRPDGIRARCGGPAICRECAKDLARSRGASFSRDNIAAIITAYREMEADRDRTARNRDMWKGQCERQAEQLTALRALLREALAALTGSMTVMEIALGIDAGDEVHAAIQERLRRARTLSDRIKKELPDAE